MKLSKTTTFYLIPMSKSREYRDGSPVFVEPKDFSSYNISSEFNYFMRNLQGDPKGLHGLSTSGTCREKHVSIMHKMGVLMQSHVFDMYVINMIIDISADDLLYTKSGLESVLTWFGVINGDQRGDYVRVLNPLDDTVKGSRIKLQFVGVYNPDLISILLWILEESYPEAITVANSSRKASTNKFLRHLLTMRSDRFGSIESQRFFTVMKLYQHLSGNGSLSYYTPWNTGPGTTLGGLMTSSYQYSSISQFCMSVQEVIFNQSYLDKMERCILRDVLIQMKNDYFKDKSKLKSIEEAWA